jgi:small subunit ribosomal protein S1
MKKRTTNQVRSRAFATESIDRSTWDVASRPCGDEEESYSVSEKTGGSDDFMKLYEASVKVIERGKVVLGEIVRVGDGHVLVDIGYKSEGKIPLAEFMDAEGKVTVSCGDTVEVLVVRREDENGCPVLSRRGAESVKKWDDIEQIYRNGGNVRGKIISRVRGGFSVDIGVKAFLPRSQVDRRPVKDLDSLIGSEHEFQIIKYDKRDRNAVVSRRAIIEAQRMDLKRETLKDIEEGVIVEGAVTNFTHYGLFVDLGGVDGFVHISNMSWGRVGHPSQLFHVGDKIKATVLEFDRELERVSLGIKQLTPDPWSTAQEKYPLGSEASGRIVEVRKYGAFVELEEGLEGLIHISELPHRKGEDPLKELHIGDVIKARVIKVSREDRKLLLSISKSKTSARTDDSTGRASDKSEAANTHQLSDLRHQRG